MTHSDAHEPRAVDVEIQGENLGRTFLLACRREADENLVTGWAKSTDQEGASSLHLEGLGYQIDTFLQWLREGVSDSRIGRVLVTPADRGVWSDFLLFD